MNVLYLIIFGICCFLCVLIGGKKYRTTTLYALAIGGAVNANFFNAITYPIKCFNLPFGIDSIIYTLFIFCVILMYFHEGKKSAYVLTISSIVAIMFSAVMQVVAILLTKGSSAVVWLNFADFVISSVSSLLAIYVMINILELFKNQKINKYIVIVIAIVVASVINSGFYFGLSSIESGGIYNLGKMLLASLIGKTFSLLCALGVFCLLNICEKKSK